MKTLPKHTIKTLIVATAALALLAGACSSNGSDDSSVSGTSTPVSQSVVASSVPVSVSATLPETLEVVEVSVVVPFTAANGQGTITISGDDSPVAVWFSSQPGEISLDLVDADAADAVSVVEEVVGFWFFRDENSGDVPPSIFESSVGGITDSVGTRYVVAAELLGPAPGTETTTTTSAATTSTTTAASSVPDEEAVTSETPSTTSTTSTSTTTSAPTTTAVPVVEDLSPAELRVQVLNGSGIAGAAGRLSARLRDAGYDVLPAGNAPSRFSSSAVYYVASAHQNEAETVAEVVGESATGNDNEIAVASLPATGEIDSGAANVVVLIGRDSLGAGLRSAERTSGLRRTPRTDVALPLPDDVPRDRYVPGLTDIQIFSQVNDEGTDEVKGALNALSGWFNIAGRYTSMADRRGGQLAADLEEHMDYEYLQDEVWPNIERTLAYFGFTPQNVCGAPAGYSFTDLIRPTREFDAEAQTFSGDAIFTTDRLLELHGGQRINPSENLDFYIRQAVQAAHDILRSSELLDETETMQLILCEAWISPEGEIPAFANSLWYGQFIPGVQPRESLLSQGTYHLKDMSENGNLAYVVVCHPTLGERHILLHWREAGYRAELLGAETNSGCQAGYESQPHFSSEPDTFKFPFGEHVFSASDLMQFPRS